MPTSLISLALRHFQLLIITIILSAGNCYAEGLAGQRRDSSSFTSSNAYKILHVGLPLVATGTALIPLRNDFQEIRHFTANGFRYHYDDYLQYTPAAATLILKAAGVRSRSSWGRMLASDAIGFAAMTALVNAGKYSVRQLRPDNSTRNSFPSGHTATAFAAATMLHKEYGESSPWYSIAGYTAAAATGISRILNNRHWISDVIAGAGIGIISMELGYFIGDLIFKDKGIDRKYIGCSLEDEYEQMTEVHCPSFAGTSGEYMIILDKGCTKGVRTEKGVLASLEGAGFFNDYIGVGGAISYGNITISSNDGGVMRPDNVFPLSFSAGVYGSCQMPWKRFSLDGKLLCGYTSYRSYNSVAAGRFDGNDGASFTVGLGIGFRSTAYMKSRIFANWHYLPGMTAGDSGIQSVSIGAGIYFTIAK